MYLKQQLRTYELFQLCSFSIFKRDVLKANNKRGKEGDNVLTQFRIVKYYVDIRYSILRVSSHDTLLVLVDIPDTYLSNALCRNKYLVVMPNSRLFSQFK